MSPKKKSGRKPRTERKFPALTFEEALTLAKAIQEHAGGQKVRRLILFEKLDLAPESSETRRLITASNQYGLTKGSYMAEHLELSPLGAESSGDDVAAAIQMAARFELAIKQIEPFKALYERLKNSKLPAKEVMVDFLREENVPEEERGECVDTFVLNAKFLRLLRTISGSQRLVSIEQVIEEAGTSAGSVSDGIEASGSASALPADVLGATGKEAEEDFSKICFYITPIGDPGSEHRRHSDFMMEYIIQPAVASA